jgi:hypothetical protein
MIGGIVGSHQAHHAAPYSITEEFVSVYRLHPLLPDDYEIRDHRNGQLVATTDFDPLQGHGTRQTIDEYGVANLLYSFGVANPGAITLHNHPRALQNHVRLNGDRMSATSTTATSTASTSRSACSGSRFRRGSGSATPPSGSSS